MISAKSQQRAGRTVLIVDDTPANLGVVVDHLEDEGLNVAVAQGGEEALDRARFVRPDLILLDVMMPGLDGFETCRRLKADEATCAIPVIFMTALDSVDDKVAAFVAGGVDYVSKPFQVEELLARVRTHLDLQGSQQQLQERNQALQDEIAARRSAEEALRKSEVRFRRLFETARDGIIIVDPQTGQITDVNPALAHMVNRTPDEMCGKVLWEHEPFRANASCRVAIHDLQQDDHVSIGHWVLDTGRGTTIDVEVNGSAYRVDDRNLVQCTLRDITDRKEAEARIRYMALHDALTGLPNRTLFIDRVGQVVAQARRHESSAAVLVLDLDRFKHVNDSLGHHVGDLLLEEFARRLRTCIRESDTAARLGGDEFAICLPDLHSAQTAETVAAKILAAVCEPFQIEQHDLVIGASIGIARFPGDGVDPGTLLRAADTAMYDAKANGRGLYRYFTPELNEAAQLRHTLVTEVRNALQRDEFVLYYQPQLSLTSEHITGVEALLRWEHPQRGIVSPSLFIPLLEELGLMPDIGEWVLHTACAQAVSWSEQGLPPMRIAVNLSAQQFYRGNIVQVVSQALGQSGLAPHLLELELTESLTLDETEATVRIMGELKNVGVSLTLDDFGTGWSSLSYLRRFPLDRIKIDRSFMRDVTTHDSAAAVVHSILNLAQSLGLTCVAEGVETTEQLSYLKEKLCSEMQGYLFSQPLPAAEMPALLRAACRVGLGAPNADLATPAPTLMGRAG